MFMKKFALSLTVIYSLTVYSTLEGDEMEFCSSDEPQWSRSAACESDSCDVCCLENYSPRRLYFSHVEGDSIAFRGGYTSVGIFAVLPFLQRCNWVPFIDVRGHVFNDGKTAANLGGGVRYLCHSLNRVFGVNAYYDYREGPLKHYHQAGVGIEVLGSCLDLRVNGYFPIGDKIGESRRHKFKFPRGQFAICRQREEALSGFDAEIGRCINCYLPSCCSCVGIYAAIGPYYYESRSCADDVWGGQLRLQAQKNCFNFEVGVSYDDLYHTSGYARIEISMPFSWPCCKDECCQQVCGLPFQPVHRQEMIVLSKKHCFWKTNFKH